MEWEQVIGGAGTASKGTVPQVFINGRYIGGYEELLAWSKKVA